MASTTAMDRDWIASELTKIIASERTLAGDVKEPGERASGPVAHGPLP